MRREIDGVVSIRPGARAPGIGGNGGVCRCVLCFNPPRSAGSGESVLGGKGGLQRMVSIRPGARAPGNRQVRLFATPDQVVSIRPGARAPGNPFGPRQRLGRLQFQSAPERGLRGILAATLPGLTRFLFQSARSAGSGESSQ